MKRRLKGAAAALLLCGLLGCGGEQAVVQVMDKPEAQPEYLSFFSPDSLSGSDVGKYWSEQFSAQYEKTVYVDYDGASYYAEEGKSYRELLEKRLQSSQPDDLYIINAEDVIEFHKKGYWMDLSEMDFVQNLSEAARYQSTYNGKVFSVPLEFTGFGLCWNVTMLREHGLAVPQNLAEFWNVCETLKAAGITPYGGNKGYALTVPAMCRGLAPLYESGDRDAQIDKLNRGETPISSYLRGGYELLEEMISRGYLDPRQALDTVPGKETEAFQAGEYAFISVSLGAVPQRSQGGFEIALTGLPVLENGSVAVYGADSRLCVNPDSKHLETALEFIEMVGTPKSLDESAVLAHTMSSARGSLAGVSELQQGLAGLLQQPGQIPNQDFALHFNTWESIRNVGRELCAGSTVSECCEMLDELQRAELAQYAAQS